MKKLVPLVNVGPEDVELRLYNGGSAGASEWSIRSGFSTEETVDVVTG